MIQKHFLCRFKYIDVFSVLFLEKKNLLIFLQKKIFFYKVNQRYCWSQLETMYFAVIYDEDEILILISIQTLPFPWMVILE